MIVSVVYASAEIFQKIKPLFPSAKFDIQKHHIPALLGKAFTACSIEPASRTSVTRLY
jgi:hypothetical protein